MDYYTLHKDEKTKKWRLEKEGSNRAIRTYDTKAEGVSDLPRRFNNSNAGASVQIRKLDGRIQEERTYPGSKDPRASLG
ncbi:MAG: DUF2188 domain-containing protein [Acidimicrobiaceae bacterium]|nr:DUF2188 domain-containing protein [Acidimicrobiaceae bacterium]